MEKIKTHIKGFDKLVSGGLTQGKTILLTGTPGTGKTIFGLQYIYNGVIKDKQKGLYISFEEPISALINQAGQFGWDLNKHIKSGMIDILHFSPKELLNDTLYEIISIIKKKKYVRVVIDSLSALAINVPTLHSSTAEITPFVVERFIYSFIDSFKELEKTTTLFMCQTSDDRLSRDGVSEFIADGIIKIDFESMGGNFSRSLQIRKMRECKNNEDFHPLEIGKKGVVVHMLE